MKRGWISALALVASAMPKAAYSSPWTLPSGRLVVVGGFDFQLATSEFLDSGGERPFPLDGRFAGATFVLSTRLGITDRLEFEAALPIRLVSYVSDPVILRERPQNSPEGELDFYRNNVVDFSRTSAGVGDLSLAGRYRILLSPFALTTEFRIKAPSGYEGPQGTFGPEPTSVEAFDANRDEIVVPANVRDDVTLGDGQLDLSAQLLAGVAFSTGTFIRLSAGYKLRLGGAGDQVIGDFRIGQALGSTLLLFAGANIAYTIQNGRLIGITAAAEDPELPSVEYVGSTNIRAIPRRLQNDRLDVTAGAIFRATKLVEVNLSYNRTVWGTFTAATNTVSFGVAFRTNIFGD